MAKLLVDFDDKGETVILEDSETQTKENQTVIPAVQDKADISVISEIDDIDMKPDDTLEDDEDEDEEEGEEEDVR